MGFDLKKKLNENNASVNDFTELLNKILVVFMGQLHFNHLVLPAPRAAQFDPSERDDI